MRLSLHYISIVILPLVACIESSGQTIGPPKNQIKFSPFKLVDPVNPGIELSLEHRFGNRSSTQLSYAYMINLFPSTGYTDYSGNRIVIEQKYFLRPLSNSQVAYLSLEFSSTDVSYNNRGVFGYKLPGVDSFLYTYVDTFHIQRKTASLNIKAGQQFYVGRFVFDMAIGVGIKRKNVMHSERIAPEDEMEPTRHPNAYYIAEQEGKYFTFNLPFSFKFGYTF